MSYKNILRAGASLLLVGSLAACDDPARVPTPAPTPAPAPSKATFQSKFGAAFEAIFNRATTEDPVDPKPSDVPPLAPASDPLDNND